MSAVASRRARHASGSTLYLRRKARDVRERFVAKTGISKYKLEQAQIRGLVLAVDDSDDESGEIESAEQVKIIRGMAISLQDKRKLRDEITKGIPEEHGRHRTACCADTKISSLHCWRKAKNHLREMAESLSFWTDDLKNIEGLFGGGVLTYFIFLKWLFILNVYIFVLVFTFINIPQMAFTSKDDSTTTIETTDFNSSANSSTEPNAATCSQLYIVDTEGDSDSQPYVDFLLGTGWMEKTIMFYGDYNDKEVLVSTASYNYNKPLAYVFIVLVYFLLSLVLIVTKTAHGIRDKMLNLALPQSQIGYQMFVWWDYSLSDEHNSYLLNNNICREIKYVLENQRRAAEQKDRSHVQSVVLLIKRALINLVVIVFLSGAGYLIYFMTASNAEITHRSDYQTMTSSMQLLVQYMTVLTITALNVILPVIFKILVTWEDYSNATELKWTLARTVFLKMASLVVLLISLYAEIQCTPKDQCNVGTDTCNGLRCWETRVGQEFYRLVILNFFVDLAVVFFLDFPRKFIVTNVNWEIIQKIGLPEFDIPQNILDLIHLQVLVWFGTYFAPLIPGMTIVKLFLLFYMKMVSLFYNFAPSNKPYRASDTNFFVLIVLMGSYSMCAVPIMYIIWRMAPSTGCGPFRNYDFVYDVMTDTVDGWPGWMQGVIGFLSSAAFGIPCFIVLILSVYYSRKMMNTYEDMIRFLREQLLMEGHDKKFLIERLQYIGSDDSASHRKRIPSRNNGGHSDMDSRLTPVA